MQRPSVFFLPNKIQKDQKESTEKWELNETSQRKNNIASQITHNIAHQLDARCYSLGRKKSDVFDFQTSCLTVRLIQKFCVNYKINK